MEKRVASRVVATDIYHYIRFHNAFQSKVNTPHPTRRIVMRGTKAIVLIAGLLSASRLWLASLQTSNFYGSSLPGLLPDKNTGVVNSNNTDRIGWIHSTEGRKLIPLNIITDEQGQNVSCSPNTKSIFNNPLPSTNFSSNYKIPFVIHQTFKTRCAKDDFYQLTLAWKTLGVPYYFHDDAAIDRLVGSW